MLITKASQLSELPTLEAIQLDEAPYGIQAYGVNAAGQLLSLSYTAMGALVVAVDGKPNSIPWIWNGLDDQYPDGPIYTSKDQAKVVAKHMCDLYKKGD